MVNLVKGRIAIIPARSGSKRIPNKNIISLGSHPLIAWTIKAAMESNLFDRIVVSTDCEEIAAIAHNYGAQTPFLRDKNSDDFSPVSAGTINGLLQAEGYWSENFDVVVQLMPTCPFRSSDVISRAVAFFESGEHEFQISCSDFGWMNPRWACEIDDDGVPNKIFSHSFWGRSQDLEQIFHPTGAVWIAARDSLIRDETFYGLGHRFYAIDWISALDIDNFDDLELARVICKGKGWDF